MITSDAGNAMTIHTLLLVGHGNMGSVLLERWRQTQLFAQMHVISPHHAQAGNGLLHWHRDLSALPASVRPDVIAFAVKPAMLETLLPHYAGRFAAAAPLYLSVAAGKTLGFYQRHLGAQAHVVRAMPNTPARVGEAMTALCAADTLSAHARDTATRMMQAIGDVLWVEEERMDAVTALSGCGPAYMFRIMDSLVKAGMESGLSEAQSRRLVMQTVKGSHSLAVQSGHSFAELGAQVASPGGATEAALRTLEQDDVLARLMRQAVQAALTRSREMAD